MIIRRQGTNSTPAKTLENTEDSFFDAAVEALFALVPEITRLQIVGSAVDTQQSTQEDQLF